MLGMANDDYLMIQVLQIAEDCDKDDAAGIISPSVGKLYYKDNEEYRYFCEARNQGWIERMARDHLRLTPAGREKLDQHRTDQKNRQRETERHEREKEHLRVDKIAIILSAISLLVSFFSLFIVSIHSCYSDKVFNVKVESPLLIVRTVESLANVDISEDCEKQRTDSDESNSDADADVHEN